MTIPSGCKDAKQLALSYTVGENVNWYKHLGKVWQLLSQLEHSCITWPSKPTPRDLPKTNANMCPQSSLYLNVHSISIHDDPETGNKTTVRQQENGWSGNAAKTLVRSQWENYSSAVKGMNYLYIHTTWTNLKNIVSERSQREKSTLYMTPLIWNVKSGKSTVIASRSEAAWGWGWSVSARGCDSEKCIYSLKHS